MQRDHGEAMAEMEEGRDALRPAMATTALRRLLRCLLRASAEAREKAGNEMWHRGLSVACWGFNCRAQARRGLAGQAVGDVRRHTVVKSCCRSGTVARLKSDSVSK